MLKVKARQGLSAGKFRDGDLTVTDGAWSDLDLKKPKERAFLVRWAGMFVVVLGGQDAALADAGLELRADGRIVDKNAPAPTNKKEPPKKA